MTVMSVHSRSVLSLKQDPSAVLFLFPFAPQIQFGPVRNVPVVLWPRQPVGGQTGRWQTGFISFQTTSSQLAPVLQPPATQRCSPFPISLSLRQELRPSSKPGLVPSPKHMEGRSQRCQRSSPSTLGLFFPWWPNTVISYEHGCRALAWIWPSQSHSMIHSSGWTWSQRLLQWQQNDPHSPLFTQGPPCLRAHSFTIWSPGIVTPLPGREPQQCADRSLRHARLLQLLFDTSLPWVLICYCINLHV